jgi:hypothetical protein
MDVRGFAAKSAERPVKRLEVHCWQGARGTDRKIHAVLESSSPSPPGKRMGSARRELPAGLAFGAGLTRDIPPRRSGAWHQVDHQVRG